MSKEALKEAVEIFGKQIVSETIQFVQLADPDGAYTTFQDNGMDDHAEVVEMLYFD
jgi:hypothetical protein